MTSQTIIYRLSALLAIAALLIACGGSTPPIVEATARVESSVTGVTSFDIEVFGEGTEITESGRLLMDQDYGVIELKDCAAMNDSVLVMTVHGYESRGYEWITGLKNLAEYYGSIYFYRYDWEQCPEVAAADLAVEVKRIHKAGKYKKVVIFGHSYGGMVSVLAASGLGKLKTDIHVVAAPLAGFPGLLEQCDQLTYDDDDNLTYPKWDESIRIFQHRTVHAQDGAFRELPTDPQDVDLPFYRSDELPPTMDGHRLGHNWSVTWVLDKHVGKPHRL